MGRARSQPDPWALKAQREGYPARSVYKLEEIDRKDRILAPAQRVLELGAAPGSWSRYVLGRLGSKGRLVAVDLQPLTIPPDPRLTFLQQDIAALDLLAMRAQHGPFDVVLSDLAPGTTGARLSDHYRSLELARLAIAALRATSRAGAVLVCKFFDGEGAAALFSELRPLFGELRRRRPKAVRPESVESYLVGKGLTSSSASPPSCPCSASPPPSSC